MSAAFSEKPFPRAPLISAAALIGVTLACVALMRLMGIEAYKPDESETVMSRELRFTDRDDGGINIYEGYATTPIEQLAPETNGFIRGTLRTFARERRRQGIGATIPLKLSALADGRLRLEDPTTGRYVGLEAFGETNANAFARLLTIRRDIAAGSTQ